MTQKSLFWNGASVGDANTYTLGGGYALGNINYESPTIDIFFKALFNGTENRGVLNNWGNELAVTGVASPLQVDTGAAIIYGLFYENTAALNVVVTVPAADTRYDLLVIRRDWTAQTARVTLVPGTEGVYYPPTCTQSPSPNGSGIYDIPLASFEITTGGVITLTDLREFCQFGTTYVTDAIGTTQIQNDAVALADKSTRTKSFFLGGGDLIPCNIAGAFEITSWLDITHNVAPTWGGGAANEEAWRLNAAVSPVCYFTFRVPMDFCVSPLVGCNVWWVNNAVAAPSFNIRVYMHAYHYSSLPVGAPAYSFLWSGTQYQDTPIAASGGVNGVFSTACIPLESGVVWPLESTDQDIVIHGVVGWDNAVATEDIGLMGVEFQFLEYT